MKFTDEQIAEAERKLADPNITLYDLLKELAGTINKDRLKEEAMRKRDEAEKAAYEYFSACDIGPEREWAHEFYEAIRTAAQTATIVT